MRGLTCGLWGDARCQHDFLSFFALQTEAELSGYAKLRPFG